jgi:2,4-dienoyl-CoA reductase-like NADH-dependent reductase (Old Yellow Enzyme family)
MSLLDIRTTVQMFINGAIVAEKTGFAGIELHGAHGYLISLFLSPTVCLLQNMRIYRKAS